MTAFERTPGDRNQNPPDIGFWALVREDFVTHDRSFVSRGFWTLFAHRFGNWRMDLSPRWIRAPFSLLYRVLKEFVIWGAGISLDYTVVVGRRVHLWHQGGMVLGARRIGNDVHIRQNTTFGVARRGDHWSLKPTIGDGVDVGAGAVIVGPVEVGEGAIIGANAVVLEDVPSNTMAVGVPARLVRRGEPRATTPLPAALRRVGA